MSIANLSVATIGLFLATTLIPLTASSQEDRAQCGPDGSSIIAYLEKDWGEDVIAMAMNDRQHMVRWLVNPNTRTWSMVVSLPNGAGCLVASGRHFEPTAPVGDPS